MKKAVFLLALYLMATTAVAEVRCNGGTLITSNKYDPESDNNVEGCNSNTCNGKTFCRSNMAMNWWSAHAWCRSNGRKLASISSLCPGTSTSAICYNLRKVGNSIAWTATVANSDNAYVVDLSSGDVSPSFIYNVHRETGGRFYALCE